MLSLPHCRKEVSKLLKSALIKGADRGVEFASHSLMSFLMFTTYVMLGNTLHAAVVFSSLALLNRLVITMGVHFPMAIKKLGVSLVAIKRIQVCYGKRGEAFDNLNQFRGKEMPNKLNILNSRLMFNQTSSNIGNDEIDIPATNQTKKNYAKTRLTTSKIFFLMC